MTKISLDQLTAEEKAELVKQIESDKKAEKQAKTDKQDAYKELVSETVVESIDKLTKVSQGLSQHKQLIYDNFQVIFDLKKEIYPKSSSQESHTFTSKCGNFRITLGYNMTDDYDDTVNEGIAVVKSYISSLAHDKTTRELVEAVLRLLSKDDKGSLKASRVMQLKKIALQNGNKDFIDGVEVIEKAYQPQRSKQYIRAQIKGSNNEWKYIPLGITEA